MVDQFLGQLVNRARWLLQVQKLNTMLSSQFAKKLFGSSIYLKRFAFERIALFLYSVTTKLQFSWRRMQISVEKTCHINLNHHFVKNSIRDKLITLGFKPTSLMLADGLTKALKTINFKKFVSDLNLVS